MKLPVVSGRNAAEFLRSGRVPDLQLNPFSEHGKGVDLEVQADGVDVSVRERAVGEPRH